MPAVLVTHADEPLGRRVVKTLFHDDRIERIFALGGGAAPRGFDRFLAGSPPRVAYARIDLAKHRPMTDFFHSARFREASAPLGPWEGTWTTVSISASRKRAE